MAGIRFFDADPLLGITRWFKPSDDGESFEIHTVQNVTDIVEDAHEQYKGKDERSRWSGDLHHVAHIPAVIVQDLRRRGIWDDEKALRRWLNDPDNRCFRTRPGRV